MNICIIGKGSIGIRHESIYKKLGCKVYFFRKKKNFKNRRVKNEIYNIKDLYKKKIDLFCICNPTSLHLEALKKIVHLSKNIFIEKPFVSNAKQLKQLKKYFYKFKINLFNGYMFRFDPRINDIKKKISKYKNKEIRYANFVWQTYLPYWHPWEDYRISYASKKSLGGGVLLTCSHEIDMAIYLFGLVDKVFCIKTKSNLDNNVENSVIVILKHKNNIISNITLDFSSKYESKRKFEIILKNKIIKWDYSLQNYVSKIKNSKKINIRKSSNIEKIYQYQNIEILKKIRERRREINFDRLSHAEKVIFAAKKSLTKKNFISI